MKNPKPVSAFQSVPNELLDEIVGGGILGHLIGKGRGGSSGSGCIFKGGGYQQGGGGGGYQQGGSGGYQQGGGGGGLLGGLFSSLLKGI
jgi:hypothetical protein